MLANRRSEKTLHIGQYPCKFRYVISVEQVQETKMARYECNMPVDGTHAVRKDGKKPNMTVEYVLRLNSCDTFEKACGGGGTMGNRVRSSLPRAKHGRPPVVTIHHYEACQ